MLVSISKLLLCSFTGQAWSNGGKRQKGNVHFRNRGCKEVFDCFQFSIVLGVFYCFYHHRHHHCRPTPRPQQFDLSASLSICFELILSWAELVVVSRGSVPCLSLGLINSRYNQILITLVATFCFLNLLFFLSISASM